MLNLASMSTNYTIRENPLKGLKMLEEAPAEDRTLTVDEYYRLLDAAPEYFRRIIFFACNTAMRKMEILNLQFKQIKIWMKGGEIELTETKSGEREKVTLNLEVIELLKQIAKERKIDLDSMIDEQKNEYVFTGMKGQRLFSVKKPMIRTLKNAGIEPRPFHTFRHFWTTEMFRTGVDVAKIKNLGRWKDFKTLLRYCHSYRLDEQEAVDQLSSHLSRRPGKILKMEATK